MSFWQPDNARCQAIAASAGSGKTYHLTHRIIGLLAHGVPAPRIIALTFSRKAAGEILDDVMKYLCEGGASAAGARQHAAAAFCTASQADFVNILRAVVDALPRLRLQTLDSFTIGAVRAFPFELGIVGEPRILDDNDALLRSIRNEVLRQMMCADGAAASGFGHDFKQATAADDGKNINEIIGGLVESYHWTWLEMPDGERWGQAKAIWPGGLPYAPLAEREATAAAAALAAEREGGPCAEPLAEIIRELGRHGYGGKTEFGKTVPAQILAQARDILRGRTPLLTFRKDELSPSPPVVDGLARLLENALHFELRLALDRTAGIHRLMGGYEDAYDRHVRQAGRLTFADAQLLLARGGGNPNVRMDIEYRLDGSIDHWLLDEFQDTSDLQWKIIDNLVSEVLQDSGGERSFFYVGDIKQAIYQWRSGNPRLFGQILEQWPVIAKGRLPVCRRQPQAVIATVNRVFGGLPETGETAETSLPGEAVKAWRDEWVEHECLDGAPQGYTALLQAPKLGARAGTEDMLPLIAGILRQAEPARRGLSTAILVRSNATGTQIADYLRAVCPDLEIVMEGRRTLTDSMAVACLLSLLRAAAHPGDEMSLKHLRMSPLWPVLGSLELTAPEQLAVRILDEVHRHGFQQVIGAWGQRLLAALPAAAEFDRARVAELGGAAAGFDRLGDRDIDRFVAFAGDYRTRETARRTAVRIMTIHQAKGLGFDLVILPELGQTRSLCRAYDESFIGDPGKWLLKAPRRDLAGIDPTLAEAYGRADAAACFENLCVLYVAMTRPRQALYMLVPDSGGTSLNYKRFLEMRLATPAARETSFAGCPAAVLYESGQADWYGALQGKGDAGTPPPAAYRELPADLAQRPSRRRKLQRLTPSESAAGTDVMAGSVFAAKRRASLLTGAAVHGILAAISWLDEDDPEQILRQSLGALGRPALADLVAGHIRSAFAAPQVRELFTRPPQPVQLWREKPFEAIVDGGWVSGVFDRVVFGGRPGAADSATIVDFKTDRGGDAEASRLAGNHRRQMELYRSVLAGILRIPPPAIACKLVFTQTGQVVDVLG